MSTCHSGKSTLRAFLYGVKANNAKLNNECFRLGIQYILHFGSPRWRFTVVDFYCSHNYMLKFSFFRLVIRLKMNIIMGRILLPKEKKGADNRKSQAF